MSLGLRTVHSEDWNAVRYNFQKLNSGLGLGPSANPTYAGLTLTGLTANSLIYSNSSKVLTSLGAATNGQIPIGSTGTVPVLAGITGTTNQVTVTNGAGSITLSTPQDIHTGASPTFADLTLSAPSNIYALSHDSFADFSADEHFTQASITTVGTIGTGVWNGTTIGIGYGGTGQTTQQAAIDALTNVSAATNEHVLTKDTATGNAIFKASAGGTDEKVKVDSGATADYIGANYNDGVLRVGSNLSYTDGGDFITLAATPSGSDTQVQYNNGGSFGGCSNLIYDDVNNRVGIGASAPTCDLEIENNSTNPQVIVSSNFIGDVEIHTHNANSIRAAYLTYRRSRGTSASPSADSAGDIIAIFNAIGYTNGWQTAARIEFGCDTGWGATGTDAPGYIYLKTSPDGSATPSTKIAIKEDGKIGLGTESPSDQLHIYGTSPQIRQERTGTGGGVWTFGVSYADAGNYGSYYITPDQSTAQLYLRDSSSNVVFNVDLETNQSYFPYAYSDAVGGTNRDFYIDNTGLIGYLSSGRKYKTNIRPLSSLDTNRVYDLSPVKYDRVDGSAVGEMGLIAEEVDLVMPDIVSYKRSIVGYTKPDYSGTVKPIYKETNEPETVNYTRLIVPLLREVQNLKAEIDKLKGV